MVTSLSAFLIDTTFIFVKIYETFHKTPLFVNNDGQDQTYLYGFLRDLLRLHVFLDISHGVIVFGKEVNSVAQKEDIDRIVSAIKSMNLPLVVQLNKSILDICTTLSSQFTHLVSGSSSLMQLV